jgi:PAS domain S-box-containing protein
VDARTISGSSNSDQESLVEALLEGMGESFFAFARDWRVTAFNSAAETIFGVPRAEVVGRLLWDASPQIMGTEFDRRCRRVMEERTKEEFESYSALRPDRYHEVRAFPFDDGVGVTFRDITDRQRDTQALRGRELELARVQRIGGVGGLEVYKVRFDGTAICSRLRIPQRRTWFGLEDSR